MNLSKVTTASVSILHNNNNVNVREKEAIHSGHFMVSHFEAEAQDDEDELAVPVPEVSEVKTEYTGYNSIVPKQNEERKPSNSSNRFCVRTQIAIDGSLSKLFECMSLAYRQKLTSPRWNRFRGIRLRWKDKIRLNNVIWRCWHLQFIKKRNTLICQFASPLDVDQHNKPEAVVLEGKYWKRKLAAVTAEYKKWRMFYRNQVAGTSKDAIDMLEMELLAYSQNMDDGMHMMVDEDYMGLMSDTLFSTITNQPFAFPDSREIAKAGLADFIQPSLGPLQPNLDDYMDTFEPFHDMVVSKLAPVPEEQVNESMQNIYKENWYSNYQDNNPPLNMQNHQEMVLYRPNNVMEQQYQLTIHQQPQSMQVPSSMKPNIQQQQQQQQQQQVQMYYPSNVGMAYNNLLISKESESKTINMHLGQTTQQQQQNVKQGSSNFASPLNMNPTESNLMVGSTQQQQQNVKQGSSNFASPLNMNPTESNLMVGSTNGTMQGPVQVQPPQQNSMQLSHNFKFSTPNVPASKTTTLKPASQKEEKINTRPKSSTRGRPRSRSNTRETIKKPPLISAISDPSLINSSNSALLTQLLSSTEANSSFRSTQRSLMPIEKKTPSSTQVRVKEESTPIPILPQPTPATLIITTPVNMTPLHGTIKLGTEPIILNNVNSMNSPCMDATLSTCLNSPTSSQESAGSPTTEIRSDQRRAGHIHAEQKRRYNIKNGFDMIHSLIPHLNQNPNAKLSKAAMLQKGAEYIKQLRAERNMLKEEMDSLRQQIEALNTSISNCQSLLPATGLPVSRLRDNKLQEMFDEYVRTRTLEDWKFWIFSLLLQPLLTSFNNFVSTTSVDDLYRSTMQWVEQHCTLIDLRPVVLNSLRYLCTKTDILSEPEKLASEARQIVLLNQKAPTSAASLQ